VEDTWGSSKLVVERLVGWAHNQEDNKTATGLGTGRLQIHEQAVDHNTPVVVALEKRQNVVFASVADTDEAAVAAAEVGTSQRTDLYQRGFGVENARPVVGAYIVG
jgi:hypothetical protein